MYSTGQKTKTAAAAYRAGLYREGNLIPRKEAKAKPPLLPEFAEGWRDFGTCACPQTGVQGDGGAGGFPREGLPCSAVWGMRLDGITSDGTGGRLSVFKMRGLPDASGSTALMFLRIMPGEAKRRGLTASNPCDGVKPLPKELKKTGILTPEEAMALFPADWREVWADETLCVLNKLAARTGMRLGELLELRWEYVFDGYVTVARQDGKYVLNAPVKTLRGCLSKQA